ncbi:myosin light chain 5 [Gracilinanus agilis]|uniref:myosin light chain 5 n=1 Tax=Gracilinanus agilis TaxID=191870 RepID=UPI001CFD8570|nr:myosin light chain 5 [Gracilinanus agilis]
MPSRTRLVVEPVASPRLALGRSFVRAELLRPGCVRGPLESHLVQSSVQRAAPYARLTYVYTIIDNCALPCTLTPTTTPAKTLTCSNLGYGNSLLIGLLVSRSSSLQSILHTIASRKTKKKEGGALRAQRASSNVFSNFEQTQIQEFKEAFTLMDQNRDGFIDKEDLKDTYASLGKINVKDDELDSMLKEASGPINFTMFLNLFGEKLNGTDTEETILNAFKMLDPDAKGSINKDYIKRLLMSQADKMTAEEVDQMFQFASIDAAGNLDYKALSYVITHGEEKEE